MLFNSIHSPLYYQHEQHVEKVTIIELSSSMKQGDPLKSPLFILAYY
jgi:hypothetical protein